MLGKRLYAILGAVVLLVAAAFTIQSGVAPAPVVPNQVNASNTGRNQPSGEIPLPAIAANDIFERHTDMIAQLADVEPLDNVQRHPEMLNPVSSVDLSDYYQRHQGATIALAGVASDWFQRHPESLKPGNAADLSDWFQRHPASITR